MNYTFNKEFACKYGVEEAILINHFQWWLAKNKANKKNEFIDHTWTYNSNDAFVKLFPFWTDKQIHRILKSLIRQKVLITGNYNKSAYDRTLWYAFSDESIFLNGEIHLPKRENGFTQTGTPIPVNIPSIIPVIKPIINTTSSAPQADAVEGSETSTKEKPPKLTVLPGAPPKDKTAEKEAGRSSLHQPFKAIFLNWYKKKKGIDYYWTGRDGKGLNNLIKKIHYTVPGTDDDGMKKGFEVFLSRISDNKWIMDNLNISMINSKFNELFAKAKRGGQSNDDRAAQLESIVRARHGEEHFSVR